MSIALGLDLAQNSLDKSELKEEIATYKKINNKPVLEHSTQNFFKYFNKNTEKLNIIKPFALIKQDYMGCFLSKNSSFTCSETSTSVYNKVLVASTSENSSISKLIIQQSVYKINSKCEVSSGNISPTSNNMCKSILEQSMDKINSKCVVSSGNISPTSTNMSDISDDNGSDDYNAMVVDLEVVKGVEGKKRDLLIKDKNDKSLSHFVCTLNKPSEDWFKIDKLHLLEKNCSNYKDLLALTEPEPNDSINKPFYKKYPSLRSDFHNPNIERSIFFHINEIANENIVSRSSLIIESNNKNCIPYDNKANHEIKLQVENFSNLRVIEVNRARNAPFCSKCLNNN